MVFLKAFFLLNSFFIIVGLLPHWKLKKEDTPVLFVLNIIGYLLLLVTIYALYKTGGNSVFILLVPFFVWLIWDFHKKGSIFYLKNSNEIRYLFKTLAVVNCIFAIKSLLLFQGSFEYIKMIHADYISYAKLASNMRDFGIESVFLNSSASPVPYHYFEIWITSIFSEFKLNSYSTLMLVTYPLLLTISVLLGYLLVFSKYNFITSIIFSISILFIQMGYLPILYDKIPFLVQANTFCITPWWYQKISVIYFWFLIVLVFYKYYGINPSLIALALFPIIYGTTIFAVTGAFGAAIVLKLFFSKEIRWSSIFVFFSSIVGYQLFYRFNNYGEGLTPNIDFHFIKTSINIIAGTSIHFSLFILPYMFILFFYRTKILLLLKANVYILVILLGACVSAILGWVLLHLQSDSVQVFSNFSTSITCIGIAYLFLVVNYKYYVAILLVIVSFNSKNYYYTNQIKEIKIKEMIFRDRTNGVYLKNLADYDNIHKINPTCASPLMDAFIMNDKLKMVDLSVTDVVLVDHKNFNSLNNTLKRNELVIFQKKYNLSGIEAKALFIKKNNIDFLICSSDLNIPKELTILFKNRKIIEGNEVYYN